MNSYTVLNMDNDIRIGTQKIGFFFTLDTEKKRPRGRCVNLIADEIQIILYQSPRIFSDIHNYWLLRSRNQLHLSSFCQIVVLTKIYIRNTHITRSLLFISCYLLTDKISYGTLLWYRVGGKAQDTFILNLVIWYRTSCTRFL